MRRILIIEDDAEQGAMLMRRLRQEEFHCNLVGTLAEGREACISEEYDCVVLDLGLPDSESDETTIEAIPELHWPVVVLTGSGNANVLKAVRQTGASVVIKPVGELLIEKVWSQINWRRGGKDSAVGQQSAQRRIQNSEPTTAWQKRAAIIGLIFTGLSLAAALGATLYRQVSDDARQSEVTQNRFTKIETRIDAAERGAIKRDEAITKLTSMAEASLNDRNMLWKTVNAATEVQKEQRSEIIRRLERIEDKLDKRIP